MARSRELKVTIAGDADKLDREVKRSNKSLDSLGKQTRLTSSITSKGFAAMKVGATGAAAGIAGLAIATKKVVEASIESEKSNSRMAAQLKALGISYADHAEQIDKVIQKTSQLAGLDDEDLQDAFTAIVRTTGDVNKALKDMALVADLARAKNMDVGRAGEFVAKIHAGNVGGLRRLGLEFTKTTDNVDKLKKANKDASAQDVRFAQALDARANSEKALNLLRSTFSGQAERYGKTTAGAVDRANVAFENLEETIGAAVAPTVEKAATAVAKFTNEMQDGTGQGGRFVRKLKDIWTDVKPIITGFARAARSVGEFALEHPGLVKLAAAVVGIGVALKGLRFLSAATGFSSLLKAGGVAAKALRRVLARGGTAAGEAAAANAAESLANQMPKSVGARQGRLNTAGRTAGRSMGRAFGAAFTIGAVLGLADITAQITHTLKGQLTKAGLWNPPGGHGSFWDNLIPDNLLPQIKPGEGLLGKLLKPKKKQTGGMIPGTGRGDHVPALLEPGEFVIRRSVVNRFGPTFFADLNGGMGAPQGNRQVPGYTSGGIIARANQLDAQHKPYRWGGGHGDSGRNGWDCSGAVSYALGVSPRVSGQFTSFGLPGPGGPMDTKVYANAKHVFAVFNGRGWGTSHENPGGGPGWLSYNHRSGFTIRHLDDGSASSRAGGSSGTSGNAQETAEAGKQNRREAAERSGSRAVNKLVAKFGGGAGGFSRAEKLAGLTATAISDQDTAYGQLERQFGQTEEDLGTPGGRKTRLTELGALAQEKAKQLSRQKKRAGYLRQAISKLEGLLKAGRRARDKAKGAKRAKISSRLKTYEDRLTDLKAELRALGFEIKDTELDIGDLVKEAREVAGTPDTEVEPGPTVSDRVSDLTSLVDLRERAGLMTAEQANAQKQAIIQSVLGGSLGALDERTQLQLMGDLRDLQEAQTQAVEDNTSALRDLQKSIDESNAIASSTIGISLREAQRALADMISGEIAGRGVTPRMGNAAYGVLARY